MKTSRVLKGWVLLLFLTGTVSAQVQRIDHFVLNSPSSAELIERFTEEFGLPLAWRSGVNAGISLGNVLMECSNYESSDYAVGIGLEPAQDAQEFIPILDDAGISHAEADPHYMKGEDGTEFLAYTLIDLHGMLPEPESYFFVVDYASREYMSGLQRGAAEELAAAGGGLLGVEKLEEIVIGTKDYKGFQDEMNKLPGVQRAEEGLYTFGEGPSIRLVDSESGDYFVLVIKVKSLQEAADGLKSANTLIKQSASNIQITDRLPGNVTIMIIE